MSNPLPPIEDLAEKIVEHYGLWGVMEPITYAKTHAVIQLIIIAYDDEDQDADAIILIFDRIVCRKRRENGLCVHCGRETKEESGFCVKCQMSKKGASAN